MADKTKEGTNLRAYTFEVSAVKIRELVEAIGDPNPVYRDRDAAVAEGYRDTPCPPTFITLAFQEFTGFFVQVLDALGIPLVRALHGEEEYEYLGEVYPGDLLTIEPTVASIVEKQTRSGAMDLVTLRTRITNHHGAEVMRTRSLLIERK
jgi:acyl dehydratase